MGMSPIDLRSDTITLPTDEMIEAIVSAHKQGRFGDDVIGDDEIVNELQEKVARILGKEDALLVTSGTQGNVVSFLAQAKSGDEVVVEKQSHSYMFEAGAMSSLGGLYPKPVQGVMGYILPETLESVIRPDNVHYPKTSLVVIENTHSYAGGAIIKPNQVEALASVAHDHDLNVHVDGARLFNAAVALDISADKLVRSVDSVTICLSKGLSAPVGSVVAGSEEFIHEARRVRKRLGGGMRQAGIIAAPGIIAIEKMVGRLKEDHTNAKELYRRISNIPGLLVNNPETNILFLSLDNFDIDATTFANRLKENEILVFSGYGTRIRFVLNRMVSREDVIRVADVVEEILS